MHGVSEFHGCTEAKAIAHTGHAAADDDDFRIVQAENGAQTVAEQLSGFSHGLNSNSIPVIVGTGKHVCSDLIKVIIYPVTDDAVLSQLDFFPERCAKYRGQKHSAQGSRASAAAFPSFTEHDMPDFACNRCSAVDHASSMTAAPPSPASRVIIRTLLRFLLPEFPFPIEIDTCIIIDIGRDMKMVLHPGDD